MTELYIGLMSGTSLDGVDAVLTRSSKPQADIEVLGHLHQALPGDLRSELLALNRVGPNELHRAALAGNALSRVYAHTALALLQTCGRTPADIRALGAHGQTVRHRPGEFDGTGYTLQLLNGALLAELSSIDVVCDLRSRDLAAGGQGAPLVPGFHAAVFARPALAQAVLNLGGIANITLLDGSGGVRGFDCGPGNALLDLWCQRHLGKAFDDNGAWAAQGRVDPGLLGLLLSEPFLSLPPPKSTGRDLFNEEWLDAMLAGQAIQPVDVQATLTEFSVLAAVSALQSTHPAARRLLVCGGGALNGHLMARLAAKLPGLAVLSTATAGLPPLQVEAAAFAWLAQAFVHRLPANCPDVTGARGPRILGSLHPAA